MSEQRIPVLIRIPASLKAKLTALAEREHRSVNRQIEFLLDRGIRDEMKQSSDELALQKSRRRRRM